MRIKIIGENDTARAVRTLLRQAGFAVSEPAEAIIADVFGGPLAGYVITIEEGDQTSWIHFDSVEGPLERRILRHITALSPHPVSLDRPGGEVRSEYRLRLVVPKDNPVQARAVEFGVLRGLLDLLGRKSVVAASPLKETPAPPAKIPWYRRICS